MCSKNSLNVTLSLTSSIDCLSQAHATDVTLQDVNGILGPLDLGENLFFFMQFVCIFLVGSETSV